ncbi:hypothetical protein NDU88_011525 [Pleurodeles waltl]|uniref:Uncharacterized protein n=1 Tax=Pleurodeles waltl TaxID=8319 RepID=A0AAV7R1X5_PLEWA|nr:hypothetical protein NDU88_011525 [Pleurodeles waltl]
MTPLWSPVPQGRLDRERYITAFILCWQHSCSAKPSWARIQTGFKTDTEKPGCWQERPNQQLDSESDSFSPIRGKELEERGRRNNLSIPGRKRKRVKIGKVRPVKAVTVCRLTGSRRGLRSEDMRGKDAKEGQDEIRRKRGGKARRICTARAYIGRSSLHWHSTTAAQATQISSQEPGIGELEDCGPDVCLSTRLAWTQLFSDSLHTVILWATCEPLRASVAPHA